ncbi:MAG: anti-sigma factor family protein, partial [Pyrinomonadaceae bacterium]
IMRCQDFREIMDSYLGDELLVETNHEVLRHLENCADCRSELAARRGLLAQIRAAVKNAPEMRLNPNFALKLQNELRETTLHPSIWKKLKSGAAFNSPILAAAIAVCFLFAAIFAAFRLNRSPQNETVSTVQPNQIDRNVNNALPNEAPLNEAVKVALREMMPSVVGDHKNCALHFRLKEKPITLDEAAEKYGRFYKDLDKSVLASLGKNPAKTDSEKPLGKIEFLEAHSCIYNGRRFAHIVLRRDKKIISVLVTDAGNSFKADDGAIFNQTDGNFQVATFSAARHAVFVVSDLSEQENLAVAETLLPAVHVHIERSEA